MLRLASILYSIIATTLSGIGIIGVLTAGHVSPTAIIVAAAIGAVLAVPVSYLVARQIKALSAT